MTPTREMIASLSLFVKNGTPPATAARWALDMHRHRWPSRAAELGVYADLKARGDAMLRAALIQDQERRRIAEAPTAPAWLVSFRAMTTAPAWIPPELPPAPLPVLPRDRVRALFDQRHHTHSAQRRPVQPWAILWAMRREIASVQAAILDQLEAARAAQRATMRRQIEGKRGWKITTR
jgi:hypothetical protein